MPYYMAGDYRSGYYRQGDIFGSIFGFAKKAIGTIAGIGGSLLPGPAGAVLKGVGGVLAGRPKLQAPVPVPMPGGSFTGVSVGGGQLGPLKAPSIQIGRSVTAVPTPQGTVLVAGRRRRNMNPTNVKALRRAIRREQRFVAIAKRALRGTGITISRKSVMRKTGRRACR